MPPLPALRCSPRREHKMENTHNRGCSFERELTLRVKDDDLTLFNDMQNRETENFLLHPDEDFDDSRSNLRYLSDFNLGITISARGESSDLLDADEEKNDYDWLLTPPDTPLFPSMDDEEPQTHNLPPRGRSRSQPINISNSFSMREKTHGSSQSSASPHRLSPSPRSSNNFAHFISRPSSAPRSSPPSIVRPASPSQRPSTPNKPSTSTPGSSTPMLRRMSTGSSGKASSSGRRGTSPMRTSRGNSASPKLQGWQSKLPGFSCDAPPNLRTSLSDRPSPLERGFSPIPRSGRGRHSLSPTASRSASSSHSNDQDLFSSYSRGSVVSSSDDVDSLQSVAISSSLPARRNGMSGSSRPMSFSKIPSRTSPSNSMPKRSFDSVNRQMDHRKTPQNMFRPLLSSVPTTTFYVGKANTTHRPMLSRNSLLATIMSANSDQGSNVAPDMASSEHDQNDITEWEKIPDPENHGEVLIEDGGQKLNSDMPNNVDTCGFEGSMVNFSGVACEGTDVESTYATGSVAVVDDCEIMSICSKCGKWFSLLEVVTKTDFCQDCAELDQLFATGDPLLSATVSQNRTVSELQLSIAVPELPETSSGVVIQGQHGNNIEEGLDCLDSSYLVQSVIDQSEPHHSDMKLDSRQGASLTESVIGNQSDPKKSTAHSGVRIDNAEGSGISVLLLPQPDSSKWPVVQSRAFSATNIPCAEHSYVRDNTSITRQSLGRDNASASSVDLGSSRQIDVRIQRQISCRKIEIDSVRSDMDSKSQSSCSYSDLTINAYEPSLPPKSDTDRSFNRSEKGVENETLHESVLLTGELDSSLDHHLSAANASSCREDFVGGDAHVNGDCFMALNTPNSQLSRMERHHYSASAADNLKDEDCPSCIISNGDPQGENERSFLDKGVLNSVPDSSINAEQSVLSDLTCQSDISDAATNSSSVVIVESQVDHDNFQDLPTECGPAQIPSDEEAFHEQFASTKSEMDLLVSSLEPGLDDHVHGIIDESTVIVEGPRGHMPKSLTLAEATDTILFCSSIIHDIAYKATTIGMEKELMSHSTVTLLGKSVNDQNDSIKMMPNKHTPKSQKLKRRKLETKETKSPLTESGNNLIVHVSTPLKNAENIPNKALDSARPPKLESKCNCAIM